MATKDPFKNLSSYELVWSLLLLKPQSLEGKGRLYLDRFCAAIGDCVPKGSHDLEAVFSACRMGHTIYQHADQLHTEIYYIRAEAYKSIQRDLEERLGPFHLNKFKSVA